MDEWTEQEEQQIIERAKAGDPEANYALSLWALRRGEEEPDEPRWNRLAAKCLVKSAQAGYGPAREQMASLLNQSGQSAQSAPPAAQQPAKRAAGAGDDEPGDARPAAPVRRSASASRPASTARRAAPRRRQEQDDKDEDGFDVNDASWDNDGGEEADGSARTSRGGRLGGFLPLGRKDDSGDKWSDDKWRKMEFICVVVCAALLIVIAVMIISGRHGDDGASGNGGGSAIPPAGDAAAAGSNSAPAAGDYPDAATQAAIMAADLDIFPSPEDYVTEPTSGTVTVSSEYLRLRKGPNTTYEPIAQMPNKTTVSVFAKKNDWDLVLYQGSEGTVYGWCSSEYVILTAGAAAATDAPGTAEG